MRTSDERRRWRRRRRREPRQDAPRVGREALEVGEAEEAVRGVGADGELARVEHAARPRRERDAQRAPRRVERELQRLAARRSILEATAVVAPPVRGQPVRRGELARARREAGHRGRGAGADGPERVAGDREERKVQRDGRRLGRRARDPGARGGRQGPPRLCPRGRRRRGRGRVATSASVLRLILLWI